MKELLKEGVTAIIGVTIGLVIYKLIDICFGFMYNHFGENGLYIMVFIVSVVVSTIVNYVYRKSRK